MLMLLAMAGMGGLLLTSATILAYRFALFGTGLVLLIFLVEATFVTLPPIGLGGISVFPQDMVFIIVAAAGAGRLILSHLFLQRKLTLFELGWMLFGLLLLISFAQGSLSYGLQVAGVEFRQYFYFFAGTLYIASFPIGQVRLKRITRLWLLTAGVVVLLAMFRWIAEGAGLSITAQWEGVGGPGLEIRVLNASQTFFLAQTFLLGLYLWLAADSSRLWRYFPMLLLPVVVLLQHRTVWVACLAAILLVMLREKKVRSKMLIVLSGGVVVGLILAPLVAGGLGGVTEALNSSTAEALNTQESTFTWRLNSWQVLLTDGYLSTYADYLLGQPFGTGYARYVPDVTGLVTESPHSYYVQTLLRTGMLGLAVLLCVYAGVFARLLRFGALQTARYFSPQLMVVLLFTQLIFFVTYTPSYEQSILLGLAMSFARRGTLKKGSAPRKMRHLGTGRRKIRVTWPTRA